MPWVRAHRPRTRHSLRSAPDVSACQIRLPPPPRTAPEYRAPAQRWEAARLRRLAPLCAGSRCWTCSAARGQLRSLRVEDRSAGAGLFGPAEFTRDISWFGVAAATTNPARVPRRDSASPPGRFPTPLFHLCSAPAPPRAACRSTRACL
eukprot:scaffold6960_cov104-Isochrysis_galbana.AAC.2